MSGFLDQFRVMLGGAPKKPANDEMSREALEIHAFKRTPEQRKLRRKAIREELEHATTSYRWRKWRWTSIIVINLLFVVSFWFDVQLVEGSLTASRFVGFHMADLNAALQVVLAYKELLINLLIGIVTVGVLWWLVGGRAFCSWACPYHLLAEFAEMIHLKLAARGLARDHSLHRGTRTAVWLAFIVLAFVTGYTVFEVISPVGILSRGLIYGAGFALLWVVFLLLVEIFYSRRFWCRYMCPIGLTYGFLGSVSPLVVRYDLNLCLHEGECRAVCMVPHVLEMTKKNRADEVEMDVGADCTRCAMCLEACPTQALTFKIRGTGGLL